MKTSSAKDSEVHIHRVDGEIDGRVYVLYTNEAIFAAYGWKSDMSDEEILENLLSLNLERGGGDGAGAR